MNDVKGFYPHIKKLKKTFFKFKKRDMIPATEIYAKMKPKNHTMVSIHVRLTDFEEHLKWFGINKPVRKNYIGRAMDYIASKYNVSYALKYFLAWLIICC